MCINPTLLRLLPRRLLLPIYYRVLLPYRLLGANFFKQVSLQYAPAFKMDLNPEDSFHGEIAVSGIYEEKLTKRMMDLAALGGTMVDVGANYGYYTLLWCGGNATNRVVAFEAAPKNMEALMNNAALNTITDKVTFHQYAVSNRKGTLQFDLGPVNETGWGGIADGTSESTITVDSVRLDQCLKDSKIDVLKVDCEGADALVLEGAKGLLEQRCIKHIFFEENRPRQEALGIPVGRGLDILKSFGYICEQIGTDPLSYYAYLKV